MPGSSTTPGRSDLAMVRPKRVAFRTRNSVGTRGLAFAAQWLAYALPYRRFVGVLTDANARLGADVDRYSFIVVDLHHLLLAGLPAHFESYMPSQAVRSPPSPAPGRGRASSAAFREALEGRRLDRRISARMGMVRARVNLKASAEAQRPIPLQDQLR
jgi:hypothetical protein